MNKYELYNGLVKLTKKTGQGLAPFVEMKVGSRIIDELVAEGLVKRVRIPYSHFPDEMWVCLTKGYCVEEESKKDKGLVSMALTFVRYYLGIKGKDKLSRMGTEWVENNMDKYNEWLEKNKEKLLETQAIEEIDIEKIPMPTLADLTEKEAEFLQKRDWYKRNVSIKDAINQINREIDKDKEIIHLSKRIVDLYGYKKDMSQKDLDGREKAEKDIKIKKTSIKRREKFLSLLERSNSKKVGVFDFFNPKNVENK